jgi:hypothetical protein
MWKNFIFNYDQHANVNSKSSYESKEYLSYFIHHSSFTHAAAAQISSCWRVIIVSRRYLKGCAPQAALFWSDLSISFIRKVKKMTGSGERLSNFVVFAKNILVLKGCETT